MKLAQALRKQYKIPSEIVVYYVLKIIKGQVPYSGRKWRQRKVPSSCRCLLFLKCGGFCFRQITSVPYSSPFDFSENLSLVWVVLTIANMRFITSVYMMIRPELREDWLTTGDIEAEVEDAQPQENALRAMTHYYNVRRYPEEMAETGRGELEDGEVRWFRRLLEEMSLTQG